MFEIESKDVNEIVIKTAKTAITFNVAKAEIDAGLEVGKLRGAGEFEIGEVSVRGIAMMKNERTIYDVTIGDVHVGIVGEIEDGLDEFGVVHVLCTSSVRAVRELSPRVVVAMGNIDGMVTELKLTARVEKKLKVKNLDSLPLNLEVVSLK